MLPLQMISQGLLELDHMQCLNIYLFLELKLESWVSTVLRSKRPSGKYNSHNNKWDSVPATWLLVSPVNHWQRLYRRYMQCIHTDPHATSSKQNWIINAKSTFKSTRIRIFIRLLVTLTKYYWDENILISLWRKFSKKLSLVSMEFYII